MHDLASERLKAVNRVLLLYLFFAMLALTTLLLVAVVGVLADAMAETLPVKCDATVPKSSDNAMGAGRVAESIFGAVLAALPQAEDGITYASRPPQPPVMRGGWSQDHLVLVVNYAPDNGAVCERHVFVATGGESDGELAGEWVTGQAGDRVQLTSLREADYLSRFFGKELRACGDLIIYGLTHAAASGGSNAQGHAVLSALAELLREDAGLKVRIVGHRALSGDAEKDYDLSVNDAWAVKTLLVESYGTEAKRLFAEGEGSREPIADNDTGTGRAANSRIEILAERSCQRAKEPVIADHREGPSSAKDLVSVNSVAH